MRPIELSIPLGIGTPAWPTYEPLQMKYFKRLAPNGANGQILTHSNHLGTHMDGEIHFYSPGKDMAALQLDFLMHEGAIVDLSDAVGDYDVYTSKMVEDRVEVKDGDILIIHTGYHHYGWDQPEADEIRYMVKHPGPDREFAEWCKKQEAPLARRRLRQRGPPDEHDHPDLDAAAGEGSRRPLPREVRDAARRVLRRRQVPAHAPRALQPRDHPRRVPRAETSTSSSTSAPSSAPSRGGSSTASRASAASSRSSTTTGTRRSWRRSRRPS